MIAVSLGGVGGEFGGPAALGSSPAAPPIEQAAAVVGDTPTAVEPISAGNWWLTAALLGLTLASFWTIRRFRLLRPRPGAVRRLDAIASATHPPTPDRLPLALGLILVLSALGVWAVSAMLASIPYTLASDGTGPPAQTLSLNAQVFGTMSGAAIIITLGACIVWPPLRTILGLPTSVGQFTGDLKLGSLALALALPPVLLAASAVAVAVSLLASAGLIEPPDPLAHETLRQLAAAPRTGAWWAIIAMVVVAVPIAEELIYRGLLQTGIRTNLGATPQRRAGRLDWTAVAITSVLFTVVHLGAAAPHALIVLAVLSVAMGIAYERTGRVLVPIVMHIGFNAFNILLSQA